MIVTAISDLHGHMPDLPGGDLLIIAGDLTANDYENQYLIFRDWLQDQPYRKKVFTCGNHDGCIARGDFYFNRDWLGADFLNDSGIEWEGIKIWGSPYTLRFAHQNPLAMAFTEKTEEALEKHWDRIPQKTDGLMEGIPYNTDILVTHTPPYGILDETWYGKKKCGSKSLLHVISKVRPKLHIFGHLHLNGGKMIQEKDTLFVNAAVLDEEYKPKNEILTFDFNVDQGTICSHTKE